MSLEEKIGSLAERIRRLRGRTPANEENAKNHVILPILRELGWSSDDPDRVAFEHRTGGGRIDIALHIGRRLVAFIEAKAPGKRLDNHVEQVLNYAFYEGVDLCVLTTGIEWWFFLPREKGPPMERRFALLKIDEDRPRDFAERAFSFLGYGALAGPDAVRNARKALVELREEKLLRKEIPQIWRDMQQGPDGPDPALVELIRRRVERTTALKTTSAQVAGILGWGVPIDVPQAVTAPAPGVKPLPKPKGEKRPPPARPQSYSLWGHETRVVKTWKDVLQGVFEAVHARHPHNFLEVVTPLWGKRKLWVSTDPGNFHASRPLGQSGLFVETNASAQAIQQRCNRLLQAFGHSASDLRIVLAAQGGTPPPQPVAQPQPAPMQPPPPGEDTPRMSEDGGREPPARRRSPYTPLSSYILWGREHAVGMWRDVLKGVFEAVYARHSHNFLEVVTPLWGKYNPWVSTDSGDFRAPCQLGQSGLFAETAMNAKSIQKRCNRLLQAFGHSASDLMVVQGAQD